LDYIDKKILITLIDKFKGEPVALHTLAVSTGEEVENLYDVYEPYLIQIGFLNRTPRGRIATEAAYKHLKFNFNDKIKT